MNTSPANTTNAKPKDGSSSALSNNSSDSGIYDLEEDYSFVITESSPAELIRKVEREFTPVENIGKFYSYLEIKYSLQHTKLTLPLDLLLKILAQFMMFCNSITAQILIIINIIAKTLEFLCQIYFS